MLLIKISVQPAGGHQCLWGQQEPMVRSPLAVIVILYSIVIPYHPTFNG